MARGADQQVLQYNRVAAGIHWLTAALVIPIVIIGLFGDHLGETLGSIMLHKSLGMTVFFITLLRIVWRLSHRTPPLPENVPHWQGRLANTVHMTFYTLMIAMPLSGYIFGSAGPYPMQWFGIDIAKAPIGEAFGEAAHTFHELGGYLIAALLVLHIGAALMHQFVLKDRLILRMLPFGAARS